ncbi:MAG: alpha-ketoglutarate-dependent dioxygenase AlkB [Rhizonema sp. NSF051]|nr:alpha-ketoglutarate-dependent dioxygenase AlkB [Rhizonema sp. NSF051]
MQQLSLFKKVDAPPVQYIPSFLSKEQADLLLRHCLDLEWQQNQIKMLGKLLQVPRLETIYGDEGCDYLYSNSVLLTPRPWTAPLDSLRQSIEHLSGYQFNIVIGNLYRDGRDSIGWHSDAEKSMGVKPAIASLSLGAERKFQIRSNDKKHSYDFWLGHGSLLVMQPGCQSNWKHQVPKTSSLIGRRVNLTFRPHVKGIK